MEIGGVCPPEFCEIKDIFKNYFVNQTEDGANFSVVKNGNIIINLFGGFKNNKELWDQNTIVNTFSLSKGIYAACVTKLINDRELDIEKDVCFYWPNFHKNIKVKHVLSHQSGIYRFKEKLKNNDLLNYNKIIKVLENQTPDHKPGAHTFYHAKTHGFLVENLIRRITGDTLSEYFKKNFKYKFDINFVFSFQEKDFKNVADLIESEKFKDKKKNEYDAFNNPKHDILYYNTKDWRLAGIPSMGGHGSALSIAKLYDILANDLRSNKNVIIEKEKFKTILTDTKSKIDLSLKFPVRWTHSGFILRGGWMFGKNKENFGHNGWGGSLGFGDPIEGIGVSYVTRKINASMGADIRAVNLIKKFYDIIEKN